MCSEDGSSIRSLKVDLLSRFHFWQMFSGSSVGFLMLGALPTHVGNIDAQASSSALKLCICFVYDTARQHFVFP